MNLLRPRYFWLLAFAYSATAAFVLQKLVLPMLPSLHGGHGLLMSDAMVFHDAAVQLAAHIKAEGWQAWKLYPAAGLTGNVGLLGALYAVFGVEPAFFIPFNAAAHASAGTLIYLLGMLLWPGRVGRMGGAIGGMLFVIFPSSLQWYGQNHKDTFAIAGTLLILYSLIFMNDQLLMEKRAWFKGVALCLLGVLLVIFVRPYFLFLILLALSAATIMWCVLARRYARHLVFHYLGYGALLLTLVTVMAVLAPRDRDLINGDQARLGSPQNRLLLISNEAVRNWEWHPSAFLPAKIDNLVERATSLRVAFIQYGIEMGATSQIDSDRAPGDVLEAVAYLPRAMAIGMFAPFPNTWTEKQTLPRLIGAVETCIFYVAILGMLGLFNRKVFGRSLLTGAVFSLALIMILAYVHPNVGTLYRQRYGLWFFFIACGCVGWVGLAQQIWHTVKPDSVSADTGQILGLRLKALPQLALSSVAIILITATSYLGFVIRDLILVKNYGISGHLDSFFIAAMLPMFGVTALSLPLTDAMTAKFMALEGQAKMQAKYTSSLLTVLSAILGTAAIALMIFAEPVIGAVGGLSSQEAIHEAALMLRLFLPILAFAGWTAVGNAILNAAHRPRVVAVGQAIVPLVTVIALLIYGDSLGVKAAIYGMLLGFAVNIGMLMVATRQMDILLLPSMPDWALIKDTLHKYSRLSCVALMTAAAVPLNYYFAATLEQGSVTTWALGSKMIQLVTGLAAITIGAVFLPHFSQLHRHREKDRLGQDMYFLLLSGTWLSLLLALLTQVFADPLVLAIFQSSDISTEAALHLAAILRLGSLQLPFIMATTLIIKFLAVSGFTSRPVLISIGALILNVALNFLLVNSYGILGLTMAMVVAAAASAVYLLCLIRSQCGMTMQQIGSLLAVWLGLGVLTTAMNFANLYMELAAIVMLFATAYLQWQQLNRAKQLAASAA